MISKAQLNVNELSCHVTVTSESDNMSYMLNMNPTASNDRILSNETVRPSKHECDYCLILEAFDWYSKL